MKQRITYTTLCICLAIAAVFYLASPAPPASAQVVPASPAIGSVSCTNNVPNNSTTTANLGSAVDCSQYGEVGLAVSFALTGAGTTACSFAFQTSHDGTNYGTGAQYTLSMVPNGATAVRTNITINMGAIPYIKLSGITAANNSAAMTNITVGYVFKPARKEYQP